MFCPPISALKNANLTAEQILKLFANGEKFSHNVSSEIALNVVQHESKNPRRTHRYPFEIKIGATIHKALENL